MIIKCGLRQSRYYDPRSYFGVYQNNDNHPEISKLIFPPMQANIEFDVQKYLTHLNSSSKSTQKLIQKFPILTTLAHINISKYSYGTAHFDQKTNPKDLEDHIFGYLFKIASTL